MQPTKRRMLLEVVVRYSVSTFEKGNNAVPREFNVNENARLKIR